MLVIIGGAELATGSMAHGPGSPCSSAGVAGRATTRSTSPSTLLGNLIGALLVAYFFAYKSGLLDIREWTKGAA